MRYVTTVDPDLLTEGAQGQWLLASSDPLDFTVRAFRVGSTAPAAIASGSFERLMFCLTGRAEITAGSEHWVLEPEMAAFVRAGSLINVSTPTTALVLGITSPSIGSSSPRVPRAEAVHPHAPVIILKADPASFQGSGFAFQSLIDRKSGSSGFRLNMVRADPGKGSPDYHIHAFDQFYFILEGEMNVDIGRRRERASRFSLVHLPAGVVHRNFNAGPEVERHLSFLVPEPADGDIFDYSVDIHEVEAQLMNAIPL